MSIKVIIPPGVTELTVNGLHQWDYGQQLEIEATDIPGMMVEVHFACMGMQTAERRICDAVSGKLVVTIPDLCLEQTAPIIAWIFATDGVTEGTTVKTLTLPIIPRAKPQIDDMSIPRDNTDAYTQFLTEVNSAVNSLKAGNVVVSKALTAGSAAAMTVGDAKETAGTLDNLVTPGRYYCDYSVGTPTASYGYVDVFVRYENTTQVFYDIFLDGDVFIRRKSGFDPWTDWTKGNAKHASSATIADTAKQLKIVPEMHTWGRIEKTGLYCVVSGTTDVTPEQRFTNLIYVDDLDHTCLGNNGVVYSGGADRLFTTSLSGHQIFLVLRILG